jgi:hypothetical protein
MTIQNFSNVNINYVVFFVFFVKIVVYLLFTLEEPRGRGGRYSFFWRKHLENFKKIKPVIGYRTVDFGSNFEFSMLICHHPSQQVVRVRSVYASDTKTRTATNNIFWVFAFTMPMGSHSEKAAAMRCPPVKDEYSSLIRIVGYGNLSHCLLTALKSSASGCSTSNRAMKEWMRDKKLAWLP